MEQNCQKRATNIKLYSISDTLGGAEQVLFKIAKYYSEIENSKVKICFFKPQSNDYWTNELNRNVEINYCNNNFKELIHQVKKENSDLVLSSHLMMNAFLGICRTLGLLKTRKLVVRESTLVFGRYTGMKLFQYKLAYWLGYRNIDLIITQTELMKEKLLNSIPYLSSRANVKTIPNPFDFPSQIQISEQIDIRQPFIVSAGRLIPEKGFNILIDAFAKLNADFPSMTLVILGEGKLRPELEKQIIELGIENKVILKGFVKNVYPYFNQAEVCVVSSIKEGFPNVLLQMMSQNEKVVSTLCAGGIENLEGVGLAKTNNVSDLCNAIKKILIESPDENRVLFDEELNFRRVDSFMKKVNFYVS